MSDVPRRPSTWKAPRSNIPEAEIFLKQIEKDLFADVKPRKIVSNLSKEEQKALKECRKMLNDVKANDVIRIQDKGNKFVIVDKPTDIQKAEQQIQRSSMELLEEDPTKQTIVKVERWCKKWRNSRHLSTDCESYIINHKTTAARNCPLYKTHKPGTPVRLLTSGCNSATEGISEYVEIKCAPLAQNLRSRIRDTSHMLDIIDEQNFPQPTELIIEALEIILTCNNSKFN